MKSVLGFAVGVLAVAATVGFFYLLLFEAASGDYEGGEQGAVWGATAVAAAVAVGLWVVTIVVLRRAGTGPGETDRS